MPHDVRRRVFLLVVLMLLLVFVLVTRGPDNICLAKANSILSTQAKAEQVSEAVNEEPAQEQELSFEEQHADQPILGLVNDYSVDLKEDWSVLTKSYQKIKILREDAKEDFGEIFVYYREGWDEILELEAYTITPDGKKHPYSRAQDFKEYPEYNQYSDLRVMVLTMQEVNVGSILVIKKTIRSKGKSIPNSYWAEDHFYFSKPTVESNTVYRFPKALNIRYKEFNVAEDKKPIITEDEKTVTYTWHIQNSYEEPSDEDLLPPSRLEDVEDVVEFSSFASWDDVNRWFYEASEQAIVINDRIKEAAANIFNEQQSFEDKVRACLEYLQDNFRYVSMSLGEYGFRPHPTDETFADKYGDCKDLGLLCKALLSLAGVDARLALFRGEYDIADPKDDLPIPDLFDHIVVLVKNPEGKDLYIDPQLKNYDLGEYPLSYQLAYTFVIDQDKGYFDRLPQFDEKRDFSERVEDIYIDPGDMDACIARGTFSLDNSISWRQGFQASTEKEKRKFKEYLFSAIAPEGEVLSYEVTGLEGRYGLVSWMIKRKNKSSFPVVGDMIIVEFGEPSRQEVFTKKERSYPIFYPGASSDKNTTVYHLPKGFFVEYLPKDLDLDNGIWHLQKTFKAEGNKVTVVETEAYRRAEIPAEQYPQIKKFYDELPRKLHHFMIFKKQKSLWQEIWDVLKKRWGR